MENSKTPEMGKQNEVEKRDISALDPNDLESVAGGYVYHARNHVDFNYEVIDDRSGAVLGRYETRDAAKSAAQQFGQKTESIHRSSTLKKIREEARRGERRNIGGSPYSRRNIW